MGVMMHTFNPSIWAGLDREAQSQNETKNKTKSDFHVYSDKFVGTVKTEYSNFVCILHVHKHRVNRALQKTHVVFLSTHKLNADLLEVLKL